MSVVGCDFGSLNTVIAVARNRGVDVITNEVSNRATPSLVGFGPKSRYIGEAAKTAEISNLKNTVSNLTRLAGIKTMVDKLDKDGNPEYEKDGKTKIKIPNKELEHERQFISAPLCDFGDGTVGVEVTYQGEKQKFSATQVIAMYLTKVKEIATKELKLPVNDIVISCPAWYTDAQRRAILDAADIAGLKILRLINDTTATALGYGITKTELPATDEKPRRVAFIDVGYSNYTVSVVEFKKGQLVVKSTVSNRHFGGRYFDLALVEHFGKEFKEKFKVDINTNPKAKFRVFAAVEKLKKILSANSTGPINIESLMNDVDVRGMLKREEFEQLPQVAELLAVATKPLEEALKEAGLKPDDLDAIEMVGGCTRVPALKNAIQQYYGRPLSFTLNQDEAVARGCAFSCAIHSPVFRVREFAVSDINNYPIQFEWTMKMIKKAKGDGSKGDGALEDMDEVDPDDEGRITDYKVISDSLDVFNKGNTVPSTKILTFHRKGDFEITAQYVRRADKDDLLSGTINPVIGKFSVSGVKNGKSPDGYATCKLKVRVTPHGILNVEQAFWEQEQIIEKPDPPAEQEKTDGDAMDTDPTPSKKIIKGPLQVTPHFFASMSVNSKNAAMEQEAQMGSQDKLVKDTEDKKNELESFIYELREKIDGVYMDFSNEGERDKIREKCTATEDWLYEDGEDATKAVYVSKIEELRAAAASVISRYQDKLEEERQARLKLEEEEAARRRAAEEARRKADEEQRKADEDRRKAEEAAKKAEDEEMKDAPPLEGEEK